MLLKRSRTMRSYNHRALGALINGTLRTMAATSSNFMSPPAGPWWSQGAVLSSGFFPRGMVRRVLAQADSQLRKPLHSIAEQAGHAVKLSPRLGELRGQGDVVLAHGAQ